MASKEGIFVIIEYDPDNIEYYGEISLIQEAFDNTFRNYCGYEGYAKIFTTYENAVEFAKKGTGPWRVRRSYKIVELTV